MTIDLEPLDATALHAVATDPSIASEFDQLQSRAGVDDTLHDPFFGHGTSWVVRVDGDHAAFAFAFVLPSWTGEWAQVRIAVRAPFRRRGIGTRLLEAAQREITARYPECRELCLAAWSPNDTLPGFATRHGFQPARSFWLMERPLGPTPRLRWPEGVTTRVFDGSEKALADWNDTYNASFRQHYHGVISTVEVCRTLLQRHDSPADGILLAYRGDACVGFCRNEVFDTRGEVGVLGVVPEARGIGLGRALLRWGVQWLEERHMPRVTLMVDGENETALRLYRSEGFEIARTRHVWARKTG